MASANGVGSDRGPAGRLRGLGALGHPVALGALTLLVVNDAVFKAASDAPRSTSPSSPQVRPDPS